MKKLILCLVLLSVLISLAASAQIEAQLDQVQGQELPSFLKTWFSNERINIHIALANGGETVFGIVITDGKIASSVYEAIENPTVDIYTDEQTVLESQSSNNPLQMLTKALDEKRITFKATSFFGKMKWGMAKTFLGIASSFSGKDKTASSEEAATEKIVPLETKKNIEDIQGMKVIVKTEGVVEENETAGEPTKLNASEKADLLGEQESLKKVETYEIKLINGGFEKTELKIKAGDTITWTNIRTDKPTQGMVIGNMLCPKVKSGFLENGQSYSWTFNDPGTCIIVDGIYTTSSMKIIIG